MKLGIALLAGSCLIVTQLVAAAPPVVDAVQMPAWLERNGQRSPLAPGVSLQARDKVITGQNARLLIQMPEGSLVKLGENATLGLDDVSESGAATRRLVNASLDVVRGAFRFTTQAVTRFRGERDVRIRIATVTAGIRGTDLWGKSDDKRDLVCLIEGRISVTHATQAPVMLDQPLDFFVAPKDGTPPQKAKVDQRQIDEWARETEIAAGQGSARRGGKWRVIVLKADNQQDALAAYDAVRAAGYPARITVARSAAGPSYRVDIGNLSSESEALALATRLKQQLAIAEPAVSR